MSEPKKREWFVPEDLPFHYYEARKGEGYVPPPVDREEAINVFIETETVLNRVGGTVSISPLRVEINGAWITIGYVIVWKSFAEGQSIQSAPPEVSDDAAEALEPEPELQPAA